MIPILGHLHKCHPLYCSENEHLVVLIFELGQTEESIQAAHKEHYPQYPGEYSLLRKAPEIPLEVAKEQVKHWIPSRTEVWVGVIEGYLI